MRLAFRSSRPDPPAPRALRRGGGCAKGRGMTCERLTHLTAGQPIPFGGDQLTRVSGELAAAFRPGDRLIVVQETGDLLHVPAAVHDLAAQAVGAAAEAFEALRSCAPDQISAFFEGFAAPLESEDGWAPIAAANAD